ncbi:MAG: type II secretion system protein [Bryobacteraceae bacterium]
MKRERGFTLLEVLVATVIMAIAVGGVLSALSTSLRNAGRLTDHDRAAMHARRKMDELLTEKRLPRNTILAGSLEANSGWKARVVLFELPPDPGPGQLVLDRIEVQVWWMTGGAVRVFGLEAFRRSILTQQDIDSGALLVR